MCEGSVREGALRVHQGRWPPAGMAARPCRHTSARLLWAVTDELLVSGRWGLLTLHQNSPGVRASMEQARINVHGIHGPGIGAWSPVAERGD